MTKRVVRKDHRFGLPSVTAYLRFSLPGCREDNTMSEEHLETNEISSDDLPPTPTPSLLRNYISFTGFAIIAASLTSIALLILIEITGSAGDGPYSDLVTFILVPSVL